jgi:ubiquinone/menaquinone biosynthesis C-methylase UbiE
METSAERPYSLHSENECDRLEFQAEIARIEEHLRYLDIPAQARILDAGCGSGSMSRLLAKHYPGASVTGFDLNTDYVAYARARAAAEGLGNVVFEPGDLQAKPFDDASFDAVWSQFVLYFLPRPEDAVRELRRVTKPVGQITVALHYAPWTHHYPVDPALQRDLDLVMPTLADIRLADAQRRNVADLLAGGRPAVIRALGSEAAADAFVQAYLDYIDRSDTCSYTMLWFVQGRAP